MPKVLKFKALNEEVLKMANIIILCIFIDRQRPTD